MADERIIGAANLAAPQRILAELYATHIGFITDLSMTEPGVTPEDAQDILDEVGKRLGNYRGKPTDKAFQKWVTGIVIPKRRFYAIRRKCEPFVLSAIWKALGHSLEPSKYDDYPEVVKELKQDIEFWIHRNLKKLLVPGTALVTTRVYERAEVMTRAWIKKQRTRRAAVIRKIYRLPKKSKAPKAAAQLAAILDREASQLAAEQVVREEIRDQMQESGIAA